MTSPADDLRVLLGPDYIDHAGKRMRIWQGDAADWVDENAEAVLALLDAAQELINPPDGVHDSLHADHAMDELAAAVDRLTKEKGE